MATIESARGVISEKVVAPAMEHVQDSVREARRAIRQGQHAVEDFAAGTALQVRRHPLGAVALAAAAGALAGCLLGVMLGYRGRHRSAPH